MLDQIIGKPQNWGLGDLQTVYHVGLSSNPGSHIC